MSAPTSASGPTTYVSEIPGRFSPLYVVDKQNVAALTTSTTTQAQVAPLWRAETASNDFNTPLLEVNELGTNFFVGDVDDIPENKVSITCYDVGSQAIALLTGQQLVNPTATGTITTTWNFNSLNLANIDIIRQYASPDGNIFKSEYMGDHVIEGYSASLKAKAASMEMYDITGFNTAAFRGQIQTKCYIVQSADVTAHAFALTSVLGTSEAPYLIPTPTGPASYWQQTGRQYFLKVERWRPSTGWIRLQETQSAPTLGYCKWTTGTSTMSFNATSGDLVAGDVFFLTYMTYVSNVTSLSTLSGITGIVYSTIYQNTLDTSDPIAVPTRLTPITISANNIARGQAFDLKMTLKRDRAEGIGDTNGIYGPSDAPAVTLSLDVKMTDFGLDSIMQNGTPLGSDSGGSTANDFFDPLQVVRNQLSSSVPTVVQIGDPRNTGVIVKTITSPTSVYNQRTVTTPNKGPATIKYSGKDKTGNVTISTSVTQTAGVNSPIEQR
jgi:hypothetical protein